MIKIHKNFKLNSNNYNKQELVSFASNNLACNVSSMPDLSNLILEIFNDESFISCKTSGSTGKPKVIRLEKQSLVNSACMTGTYFNLLPGHSAVSFLPMNFIAGKMMLVRAMVLGLDLSIFTPTSNPSDLIDKKYFFSAMTPMQANNSIAKLKYINTLILGGSEVSTILRSKILSQIDSYYETYGMTETATHIAVKKISKNNQDINQFSALSGVSISTNKNNCLVIDAPHLTKDKIVTNDIVEIRSSNNFSIIGRIDNIINSAGIKLIPEKIENKLSTFISKNFIISSLKDELLGNKLILIIESKKYKLNNDIFKYLTKFEVPKQVYFINKFTYTRTNKIDRVKTLETIN